VDRRQHRLATALDTRQAILQIENQPAQRFAATRRVLVGNGFSHTAEHRQINAGAEVFAGSAENDHPYGRRRIGPIEGGAQFLPHRLVHGVGALGAIQTDVGNAILKINGNRTQLR
jgi:hypothetical protein